MPPTPSQEPVRSENIPLGIAVACWGVALAIVLRALYLSGLPLWSVITVGVCGGALSLAFFVVVTVLVVGEWAVIRLGRRLTHKRPDVRLAAVRRIPQDQVPQARKALRRALNDSSPEVRLAALSKLGTLALRDDEPRVRREALAVFHQFELPNTLASLFEEFPLKETSAWVGFFQAAGRVDAAWRESEAAGKLASRLAEFVSHSLPIEIWGHLAAWDQASGHRGVGVGFAHEQQRLIADLKNVRTEQRTKYTRVRNPNYESQRRAYEADTSQADYLGKLYDRSMMDAGQQQYHREPEPPGRSAPREFLSKADGVERIDRSQAGRLGAAERLRVYGNAVALEPLDTAAQSDLDGEVRSLAVKAAATIRYRLALAALVKSPRVEVAEIEAAFAELSKYLVPLDARKRLAAWSAEDRGDELLTELLIRCAAGGSKPSIHYMILDAIHPGWETTDVASRLLPEMRELAEADSGRPDRAEIVKRISSHIDGPKRVLVGGR